MFTNVLTSASNPLLKEIRRAQQQGGLTEHGWMIAEGPHLVEEAWRSRLSIKTAVLREGCVLPAGVRADRVLEVPEKVFDSISGTSTPQGILALVEPRPATFSSMLGNGCLIVVLDGVQDPGNAGAIARAAEAFGATGVVFAKGTVSPYHPRTVRASAGSLFRLPLVVATLEESTAALRGKAVLLAAMPQGAGVAKAWDVDLTRPLALVIGSEGRGVDPQLLNSAEQIAIPTGATESLNAAVAAGVLLYEAARQRTLVRERRV